MVTGDRINTINTLGNLTHISTSYTVGAAQPIYAHALATRQYNTLNGSMRVLGWWRPILLTVSSVSYTAYTNTCTCTIHPTPCTIHPTPCTIHPIPCTIYYHGITSLLLLQQVPLPSKNSSTLPSAPTQFPCTVPSPPPVSLRA